MTAFQASHVDVPDTRPEDPRIGQLLQSSVSEAKDARVVLLGFPSDEGVRINRGRAGAVEGPTAIRRQLYRLTPHGENLQASKQLLAATVDVGDFRLRDSLGESHDAFGVELATYLRQGAVPIILGGGHETAFAHFMGYVHAGLNVSILNWDAHLDVRPLRDGQAHSGSPFRQAIEHESGRLLRYIVAGVLGHSASTAHVRYVQEKNGTVLWRDDLRLGELEVIFRRVEERGMVTFDLDALDQAYAPGVSAPACGGLTLDVWFRAAYLAGRSRQVTSIDISELNPRFDRDDQTARIAALTIWHFLRGMTERG